MNETIEAKRERQATALGYASMMLIAAWQAARIDGADKAPELLAEIERKIEAGNAGLAISIQRVGDVVRVVAAATPGTGFQDPFDHPILDVTGPLILSRAQLAALGEPIRPGDLN